MIDKDEYSEEKFRNEYENGNKSIDEFTLGSVSFIPVPKFKREFNDREVDMLFVSDAVKKELRRCYEYIEEMDKKKEVNHEFE